jgi:hypothetical protein
MPARAHPVALVAILSLAFAVAACAAPAAQPTPTPTVSETDAPSAEPESDEPSPSASETDESPAAEDELDMTLPSNFGSTDLAAGFSPDPFTAELVSGGPIDASYLGEGCRGYATAASDYDVTYEAGDQDLLRFYFVADDVEDTTLIINAPDGSWHCNDDAPDTIDPMLDFDNPESGRYDIWIGSYESGAEAAGTLYVTELASNAP